MFDGTKVYGMEKIPIPVSCWQILVLKDTDATSFSFLCWSKMDLVPVLSCGNDSKKYDGKVWWEDSNNIVEVNGKPVTEHLKSSSLRNGDNVLVKFGSKSKKLFKGVVELQPECDKDKLPIHTTSSSLEEDTTISSKKPKLSPPAKKMKVKSPTKG